MTTLERLLLIRADEQAAAVKPANFRSVSPLVGLTDAEKRERLNAQKESYRAKRRAAKREGKS